MTGLLKILRLKQKMFIRTLFIFLMLTHGVYAGDVCFLAAQGGRILAEEGACDKRYPPCSTFKIAISLMGFDAGILADASQPMWEFKPGYTRPLSKLAF